MTTTTPSLPARPAVTPSTGGRRIRRALFGTAQPLWVRPSAIGLLLLTAVLYIWGLASSGDANSFYAAAAQAASKSWKAWFFGSLDSANFITVDKPPASLWVMGLSIRLFGYSSWSLLVPQALMGVGSVALVFATVRRSLAAFSASTRAAAGLLAGSVLALTPAAVLMFRFDNPDALLVLLMSAAAYAVVRALPRASWRWLALAGALLGFAFLTKMLQGLLVLPAFGAVYLLAAPAPLLKRVAHLAVAAGALVVAAGWWVLVVAVWPASARPYIGGSTNNTVLDLVFGYNGFGRLFGSSGNVGGGSGTSGSSFGGATGLLRLFSSEMGLEVSWLLPSALLLLAMGLVLRGRRSRLDPVRAGLLLWGGWLVVTGLVFSFMSGTVHPYYTVALAPAIGALAGLGGAVVWSHRDGWTGRFGLAVAAGAASVWGFALLSENSAWLPWLRWVLLVGGLLAAGAVLTSGVLQGVAGRRVLAAGVLAGLLLGLGGTASFAVATASVAHGGSIPTVGSTSSMTGGGADGGAPSGAGPTGAAPSGTAPSASGTSGPSSGSSAPTRSEDGTGGPVAAPPGRPRRRRSPSSSRRPARSGRPRSTDRSRLRRSSCPATPRCWRSAAGAVIRRRRWRSSRRSSPPGRCTTTSRRERAPAAVHRAAAPPRRAPSRAGCRRTSPRPRSAARPSTTSPAAADRSPSAPGRGRPPGRGRTSSTRGPSVRAGTTSAATSSIGPSTGAPCSAWGTRSRREERSKPTHRIGQDAARGPESPVLCDVRMEENTTDTAQSDGVRRQEPPGRRALGAVAAGVLLFGLGTGTGAVAATAMSSSNGTSGQQGGMQGTPPGGMAGGPGGTSSESGQSQTDGSEPQPPSGTTAGSGSQPGSTSAGS
ncbi:ArnT family glycosyltransferase [Amnibacterium kyonggiense]|uniref:4-amino-4-deoxy-L-arabinose transferase-like glycosyltransferase n=1 Tax=Amnibacterium kyonggiense TaxID=595671 RepID=A0A4V3EAJ0_9MICO|nr:glycosyltransferase family 39 protein [Amnibacterium kyonggiense]TDS76814.1 4-amino-4-deoxy-L-arabinose transferase-like glycosyltransferase [Amnibacterium kyonggiense]